MQQYSCNSTYTMHDFSGFGDDDGDDDDDDLGFNQDISGYLLEV